VPLAKDFTHGDSVNFPQPIDFTGKLFLFIGLHIAGWLGLLTSLILVDESMLVNSRRGRISLDLLCVMVDLSGFCRKEPSIKYQIQSCLRIRYG
jgi:hypothetical protein